MLDVKQKYENIHKLIVELRIKHFGKGSESIYQNSVEDKLNAISILVSSEMLIGEYDVLIDKYNYEKMIPAIKIVRALLGDISPEGILRLNTILDNSFTNVFGDPLNEYIKNTDKILVGIEKILRTNENARGHHGNANWRAVSVIDFCSDVWLSATGKKAPRINRHYQYNSEFGVFVKNVYDVLGIGAQPSVAQDALYKARTKPKKLT